MTVVNEEAVTTPGEGGAEIIPEEVSSVSPQAGAKTDPNLLLKSLQEEREKRRILESKVQELEDSITSSVSSDTGEESIATIKAELAEIKRRQQRSEVLELYPQIKDKWADFEEFRSDPENKGMNIRTAAKAFLVEKELIERPRKGLEKPTGGERVPLSTGMSTEDVKSLRETNFKKYLEMLQKGQIKISA